MNFTKLKIFLSFIFLTLIIACTDDAPIPDQPPTIRILNKTEVSDTAYILEESPVIKFMIIKGSQDFDQLYIDFKEEGSYNYDQAFEGMLGGRDVKLNGDFLFNKRIEILSAADTIYYTLEFLDIPEDFSRTLLIECIDEEGKFSSDEVDFQKLDYNFKFYCKTRSNILTTQDTVDISVRFQSPRYRITKMTILENGQAFQGEILLDDVRIINPISFDNLEGELSLQLVLDEKQGEKEFAAIFEDEKGNQFSDWGCTKFVQNLEQDGDIIYANRPFNASYQYCLDLETGRTQISITSNIDLVDMGIDTSLPDTIAWRKSIRPVNNLELVRIEETINFFDLDEIEEIVQQFDLGTPVSNEEGTGELFGGEQFVAKKFDDYYFIEIAEVNDFYYEERNQFLQYISLRWKKERK